MSKFPRYVSTQFARLFSFNRLLKSDAPVFLPFYHVVSDRQLPHIKNYPYRNSTSFEKELEIILKQFRPVDLEYLLKYPFPKEKVFHLSFDDGLKESLEIIAPILQKKGIPATFFVNSAFVDNKALFHKYKASLIATELQQKSNSQVEELLRVNHINKEHILQCTSAKENILDETASLLGLNFNRYLEAQKPYLSTIEVLQLKEMGFSIGGHSHSHRELFSLPDEEQFDEIKKSMMWLNQTINPDIKAFSFPFTDWGVKEHTIKRLFSEGICDLTFGTAGVKDDKIKYHFQRYPVEQNGNFERNLKSEYLYYKLRKFVGKANVKH